MAELNSLTISRIWTQTLHVLCYLCVFYVFLSGCSGLFQFQFHVQIPLAGVEEVLEWIILLIVVKIKRDKHLLRRKERK